jgi:valyl-tRNA synthetase
MLIRRPWPDYADWRIDREAAAEMGWVVRLIGEVRTVRAEMNVPAAAKIRLVLNNASAANKRRLAAHAEAITRLARLEAIGTDEPLPKGSVQIVLDEAIAALPLAEVVDLAKERERLGRELAKAEDEAAKMAVKLGDADFVAKAPEHVIEENRERHERAAAAAARLKEALRRLG